MQFLILTIRRHFFTAFFLLTDPLLSADSSPTTSKPTFFDTFNIDDYLNNPNKTHDSKITSEDSAKSKEPIDIIEIDEIKPSSGSSSSAKETPSTSFSDLEDSFGGETLPAEPPRPKTGLYFLVDWNSFLQVGDEEKNMVNLRFAPKVGDRTRFLPVRVP